MHCMYIPKMKIKAKKKNALECIKAYHRFQQHCKLFGWYVVQSHAKLVYSQTHSTELKYGKHKCRDEAPFRPSQYHV